MGINRAYDINYGTYFYFTKVKGIKIDRINIFVKQS